MKFHLFKGNFHSFATRSAMFKLSSLLPKCQRFPSVRSSALFCRENDENAICLRNEHCSIVTANHFYSNYCFRFFNEKVNSGSGSSAKEKHCDGASSNCFPRTLSKYAVLLLGYQLSQYIEVYRSRRNQHFVCFCFVKENLYNLLNSILCSSRTIAHRVLPLSLANSVELKHPNNNASSSSDNFPQLRCIVHDAAVQTDTNFLNIDRLISECSDCLNKELEARLYYLIGLDLLHVNLYEKALHYLLKSCKYNYSKALYNVGLCYYKGYGCVQSDEKAVKFWNSAAERGNGLAMYQLGVVYLKGLAGLKCNAELGLAYMNKAAESGVVEAKTYLGALLFKSGDNQGALNLWKEAASCGHEEAKHFLESNFSTQR
ncbi:Death ligand signal enhancer [Trichinella sp. T6]|nr:Death ligand signal enhancer [Trichinella sp. T6]